MKHLSLALILIFAVMLASCDEKDKKRFLFPSGGAPEDVVQDQEGSGEFKFETVHNVSFDLQVYDEANNPVSKALIVVASDEGDITTSLTEGNGTSMFKITIDKSIDTITLTFQHPSCVTRTIEIANIQELASVNRSVFLALSGGEKAKPDGDGDGVPDDSDEFPDDPALIGTVRGEYTIAYEDLWPARGDADFNDMVVRLGITEYIDNNNMVSKIVITTRVLAAGAGYKNQFWIGVLDKDYLVVFNPKQDLNGQWNSRPKDKFVEGPVHTTEIILDPPVARDAMDPMPYDPYIRSNGNELNQVHLSFVKSKFGGATLDAENFPWAVLVPTDWSWPYEGSTIFEAYPKFKPWYESKGTEHGDWYLHPESGKVFNAYGSALSAYLLKVSGKISTGAVVGVLAAMIVLAVALGVRRRRKAGV